MFFHIPHNVFQVIAMRANDHMDVAGHDAITVYFKAFVLLAMFPAFNHDVLILISDEKVYPIYHSKTYKIKLVLVVKFIFCAHCRLKLHNRILFCKKVSEFIAVACERSKTAYLSAEHESPLRFWLSRQTRA